jgi:hypothetical protein
MSDAIRKQGRRRLDHQRLLDRVTQAHAGRNAGASSTVSPRAWVACCGRPRGRPGVLDDVIVTASLDEERVSHRPFRCTAPASRRLPSSAMSFRRRAALLISLGACRNASSPEAREQSSRARQRR